MNQTVGIPGTDGDRATAAIRWYEMRELRDASLLTPPSIFQKRTFAPDSNHRWMGSIAMDRLGNLALGYSVSGPTLYPGIRFTGRLDVGSTGTLGAEQSVIEGTGSRQEGDWGDYSSMAVDPVFDCAFWYTNMYQEQNGANWQTRIRSFRFPQCVECSGDCNRNESVSPSEADKVLAIAMGRDSYDSCLRGDANGDGLITVHDYVKATIHRATCGSTRTLAGGLTQVPYINVGTYSYVSAGAPAPLTIYLSRAANSGAAGAQVDLLFDDHVFGTPTCAKPNEARLNAHTLDVQFNPQLLDREPPTPAGKSRLRLLIVDRDNGTPITTGAIAQCNFPTVNVPQYANQFERFDIDPAHDFVTDANGGLRLADPATKGTIEVLFPAGAPPPTPNTTHCQQDGQEGRC